MDIAEFVSDYIQMLRDNEETIPPKPKLAKEIVEALADRGVSTTVENVLYYL